MTYECKTCGHESEQEGVCCDVQMEEKAEKTEENDSSDKSEESESSE